MRIQATLRKFKRDTCGKCRTGWVPNWDARELLLGGVLEVKPTPAEKVSSFGKPGGGGM